MSERAKTATVEAYEGRSRAHGVAVHVPGRMTRQREQDLLAAVEAVEALRAGRRPKYAIRTTTDLTQAHGYVRLTKRAVTAVRMNTATLTAARALIERGYRVRIESAEGTITLVKNIA